MKTITNHLKTLMAGLLLALLFQSCAVYTPTAASENQNSVEETLFARDFDRAIAEIDNTKLYKKKRNRLLYLMEKGKIEHMSGNYEASNQHFEEAYMMIDDGIKTSVGQKAAAVLTNPLNEPYKGEDFEKVTIHYYKALNFFKLGFPDKALVEAKRINIKLQELNQRYKKNKNKYTEDAFAQILQGILYEATGDINNAFIAYRNAYELYAANSNSYFGVPAPLQLKKDLLRTSKQLGFTEEYNTYQKEFKIPESEINNSTDNAIVFWENGLGPIKDQIKLTASGVGGAFVGTYGDNDETIVIPIPAGVNIGINAIAIPKYKQRQSYYNSAGIVCEGEETPLEMVENYYPIAKQCLKDRMLREVVDMAVRFGAKKGVSKGLGALARNLGGDLAGDLVELGADAANAITEKADTRNWQTLPATISYARIPVKEDYQSIIIKKYAAGASVDYDTIPVSYKKGLQLINYFDVGKATSNYVSYSDINVASAEDESVPSTSLSGNSSSTSVNYTPTRLNVDLASVELNKYDKKAIEPSLNSLYQQFEDLYGRPVSNEEKQIIEDFFMTEFKINKVLLKNQHYLNSMAKASPDEAVEIAKIQTESNNQEYPERKKAYDRLQKMHFVNAYIKENGQEPSEEILNQNGYGNIETYTNSSLSNNSTTSNIVSLNDSKNIDGVANIYFIREKKFVGSAVKTRIHYNDQFITKLKNKSWQKIQTTPGKAKISVSINDHGGDYATPLDLNIEANQDYYVHFEAFMGKFEITLMNESEAKSYMSDYEQADISEISESDLTPFTLKATTTKVTKTNKVNNSNVSSEQAQEINQFLNGEISIHNLQYNQKSWVIENYDENAAKVYIMHLDNESKNGKKPNAVYFNELQTLERLEPYEYIERYVTPGLLKVEDLLNTTAQSAYLHIEAGKTYYVHSRTEKTGREVSTYFYVESSSNSTALVDTYVHIKK
ncbi:DUF2846 domain-containing protein [Mesonia sp. K7]|uniref:DUF2846 domain-containing protein n=1 Tax=Mesonia sp. K7 TaxID=2218606 RepID=UPI000DB83913|nr:DUF2846 domain-containing protein [Mesonia sp. K7]PZD76922.1 hypothetical protein DNG35_10565 [Mesonia sp. K7]